MAEAKESKLKEYFTATTYHTDIRPTDQSGEKLFVGNARCESSLRKESPIRLNDTYRSNFVLGNEREPLYTPNDSASNVTPVRGVGLGKGDLCQI